MDATLEATDYGYTLWLPLELEVPTPSAEYAYRRLGMWEYVRQDLGTAKRKIVWSLLYANNVLIEAEGGVTQISNHIASGRGQAYRFDELVGEAVANWRKRLQRQVRNRENVDLLLKGIQVDDDQVAAMQQKIVEFAEDVQKDGELRFVPHYID